MVSLTLFAGESLHVATVLRLVPGDSAIPRRLPPFPTSAVHLWVEGEGSADAPLDPLGGNGQFIVKMLVQPGGLYRLRGTVGSTPVYGETTVPLRFAVARPESDTITSADGVGLAPLIRVPYVFQAQGAAGYEVRTVSLDNVTEQAAFLREPVGELPLVFRDSAVRHLVFFAYDANATAWFHLSTPRSSLTGTFGEFGSALVVRGKFLAP